MTIMKSKPTIREWYASWLTKSQKRTGALALLSEVGGCERDKTITLERIVQACYAAAHYNRNADPGAQYREALRVERKGLLQLSKAARIFRMAAERGDKSLGWAAEFAERNSGVRITRADKSEPEKWHPVAARYFKALEAALDGRLPEIHGGPFIGRFTIGNMIFSDPIKAGRPVEVSTMLAFEIVFYMRMLTAGRAGDSTQTGQHIPSDGKPCLPVVASLVCETLGATLDAKMIEDVLRRHTRTGLGDWPNPD